MFSFLKSIFCKSETRVINPVNPEEILSVKLNNAYASGNLKGYKNVLNFIDKWGLNPDLENKSFSDIIITPEIKRLMNNWKVLKYKCSDKDLDNFMKQV
jgi:hypothetical protein